MKYTGWIALTLVLATMATSSVAGWQEAPADATHVENGTFSDAQRITQLERQLAELQARLENLEARQGIQPAVRFASPQPPAYLAPGVLPEATNDAVPPVPFPQDLPEGGGEINGVKFRVYLLGNSQNVIR